MTRPTVARRRGPRRGPEATQKPKTPWPTFRPPGTPRILVIRRDNIGDLVCTLPLLATLRAHWPDAEIDILVNSYNRPLLTGNTDVSHVYAYTKGKHRPERGRFGAVRLRLALAWTLRRRHYDAVLIASGGGRQRAEMRLFLRAIGARRVVTRDATTGHEVDRVLALTKPLGIAPQPLSPRLVPEPTLLAHARHVLDGEVFASRVGVHISAREDENRWPVAHFVALLQQGAARGHRFTLLWSPGPATRPEHPGDDAVAAAIMEKVRGLPVIAYPTPGLAELTAAVAACRCLLASDGGHCHIAAAVGTPVLGLYCHHKVEQWRPWGDRHTVLSARRVADISPACALTALDNLIRERSGP